VAVDVDGVIGHGEIAHAYADPVAPAHYKVIDARKHAAVPRPEVEFDHGVHARRHAAGLDVECVQKKHEIAVEALRGCTNRNPIMPIAICTISSACG
jgi:hypothetical protein